MPLSSGWERAVLKGIGAPVTKSNISFLRAWQQAEGGGTANDANWNPLNTTQDAPGATAMNDVGVKSYRSAKQGIQATVKTLLNGYYGPIVTGLRRSVAPRDIAQAVANSPWGTGEGVLRVLGAGGTEGSPVTSSTMTPTSTSRFTVPGTLARKITVPRIPDLTEPILASLAGGLSPQEQLASLVGSVSSQPLTKEITIPGTKGW